MPKQQRIDEHCSVNIVCDRQTEERMEDVNSIQLSGCSIANQILVQFLTISISILTSWNEFHIFLLDLCMQWVMVPSSTRYAVYWID